MDVTDLPYIDKHVNIPALYDWCSIPREGARLVHIAVERQQSYPEFGERCVACNRARGYSGPATFALGVSYGMLMAWCMELGRSHNIPFSTPMPAVWKKYFGLSSDKEAVREAALKTWPAAAPFLKFKKNHGRAEAMFIAEYARAKSERTH